MRLISLEIDGYKNLKKLKYTKFETDKVVTVLIGNNGSGKSNLLEVIVLIFRNFEFQSHKCHFDFILKYRIGDKLVNLEGKKSGGRYYYYAYVHRSTFKIYYRRKKLIEEGLLPENIIAYYSGNTPRFPQLFEHHQRKFVSGLVRNDRPKFRRLFFAKEEHIPLILITNLIYRKKTNPIFKELGLSRAKEIRFKLGRPRGFKPDLIAENDRFWGARGRLNELFVFLETLDSGRNIETQSYRVREGENRTEYEFDFFDSIVIGEKDIEFAAFFTDSPIELFRLLEEAVRLKLIRSVEVDIIQNDQEEAFDFEHLSEGEKQLVLVLGMLELTKKENTLFLLDEPTTHLNPRWKYQYLELIKDSIGAKLRDKVQIFLASHEPLIISGLDKENVLHFAKGRDNSSSMNSIREDTLGMGVDAILTSELFGLNTTMDIKSWEQTVRRQELLIKQSEAQLSENEDNELTRLTNFLNNMDFNDPFYDPLYRHYIKALGNLKKYKDPYISKHQRKIRDKLADDIFRELMEGES